MSIKQVFALTTDGLEDEFEVWEAHGSVMLTIQEKNDEHNTVSRVVINHRHVPDIIAALSRAMYNDLHERLVENLVKVWDFEHKREHEDD